MKTFLREYEKLNEAQKEAVDTIQGPVIVVAGPGSGKTQLLSLRVANVLRKTDAGPNNILCLTFTDSAATEMRERLVELIGADAHKVAIHTFHSFGVEVINQYPEYFYNGAEFMPTDEVLQLEILQSIFESLDHDNPLYSIYNGQFTYLKDVKSAIDQLKKAGLSPQDLEQILDVNDKFIKKVEPHIQEAFSFKRLSKKHLPELRDAAESIEYDPELELPEPFKLLSQIFINEFLEALDKAEEINKTTPVTQWKNDWLRKDKKSGEYIFRDRKYNKKLRAIAEVYERYQTELAEKQRFDFSDMVLEVLKALKKNQELRYDLQERFQYILVDEFQDTNDAQMQLLHLLTDNPVHEGRPDILVVGDDDQAIYKFQGAEVNNILDFHSTFKEPLTVTLTKNYRSRQDILDTSKKVIAKGETRLENRYDEIEKELVAANSKIEEGDIKPLKFDTAEYEYAWIADEVQRLINKGVDPDDVAILGRKHSYLEELMPHLNSRDIPVRYERRADILKEPHVLQLVSLARLVMLIAEEKHKEANALLSEVLSYPFWEIDALEIWKLSRKAYESRKHWLDLMVEMNGPLKEVADFLIECSKRYQHETMESMLDILVGAPLEQLPDSENDDAYEAIKEKEEGFRSPFREYYFSREMFENERGKYVAFLSALRTLRQKLREYRRGEDLLLKDFIEFIDIHNDNNIPLVDETPFVATENAVHVMTAHKAKGQEFDTVFVISCQENVWASSRGGSRISYPKNLPIAPAGDTLDDQLRLFFVAMTRAKRNLYLTGYKRDHKGKESLIVPFLAADTEFSEVESSNQSEAIRILSDSWMSFHPFPNEKDSDAILSPILEKYQLSVTHFNNFLDVTRGGPKAFLLQNLLKFPQAMPISASFGDVMHRTLQKTYGLLRKQGGFEEEEVLEIFTEELSKKRMSDEDRAKLEKRGVDGLKIYLKERKEFMDKEDEIERDFKKQGVVIKEARLSGKIDKMTKIDEDSYKVFDFKTGNPIPSWTRKTGYDAIKAWKYKNQLIFYKLLVENSRDWSKYTVNEGALEFIEPVDDEIKVIEYSITDDDVERLSKLIEIVWNKINNLDFPKVDSYEENYKGIVSFEEDLLEGKA